MKHSFQLLKLDISGCFIVTNWSAGVLALVSLIPRQLRLAGGGVSPVVVAMFKCVGTKGPTLNVFISQFRHLTRQSPHRLAGVFLPAIRAKFYRS